MTTTELRRKIKNAVDQLPAENLQEVRKMVAAMARRTPRLSAEDRMKIAAMKRRLAKAERDIAEGRFTTLDQLRRKY